MYNSFRAADFDSDKTTLVTSMPVEGQGTAMLLVSSRAANITITKQQAMEFFGLIDPNNLTQVSAAWDKAVAEPAEHIVAQPAVFDWDVLFLESPHTFDVQHELYEAPTKEDAIRQFREDHGTSHYIISVVQRDPSLGILKI